MTKPLKRLFIANRGEIARRIATTCKRLGIESVALTDRMPPPSYLADVVTACARVEEESPALYLDAERMIRHALESGCDSVHPGFGFLSENAGFAAKVEAAGLTWVGPNPGAIDAMASKAAARARAMAAGVPCLAGLAGFAVPQDETGDFSELEAFARKTGLPLLIKAALGGGGKGMRLVHRMEELRPAALRARSEALASFGDGALVCEQYLTAPRHVEVQILADRHGKVVAVGDRDCSVQRRHQKIVEEAPAPALSDRTRAEMHAAAIRLAADVGYDSTGTVEFLVDWSPEGRKLKDQRFYFLEMNTRLQVEHPVTEEVFGLDLVEWQLRVAGGGRLPGEFGQLTPRGASVEVRIYAEDPANNFFPAPGPVAAFAPAPGPGLRWETGLDTVDEITGRFDPMIAKLVATAATRRGAYERLADALTRTFYAGPAANFDLLHDLATATELVECPVTTHFLADELPTILGRIAARRARSEELAGAVLDRLEAGAAVATVKAPDALLLTQAIFTRTGSGPAAGARGTGSGPALHLHPETVTVSADGRLEVRRTDGLVEDGTGRTRPVRFAALRQGPVRRQWLQLDGCVYTREMVRRHATAADVTGAAASNDITAPVPGKVVLIKGDAGQAVELGDTVVVLESMKMEFEVKSPRAGRLNGILVKPGDQVTAGQILGRLDP